MENREDLILTEIRETVSSMRVKLHELEAKLGELEASMAACKGKDMLPVQDAAPEYGIGTDDARCADTEAFPEQETGWSGVVSADAEPVSPIIDAMAKREAWRTDIPGSHLDDIRSAISLNDRILFIKTLFRDDTGLFSEVLDCLNGMDDISEAQFYIAEHFPEWDMDSDTVYRFMMAVRRKLR